ncbi:Rho-GTPase-activating protein 5 [Penicillium subrubescens]|uniref:Rho-GTPase-activating protein 5 n=2 Tax=Penicillium subrubescens TaxID=1316194 RepID=A0A1Q5ULG9_9EURO|nr:Rho-GTPase-activating protein 5 [Penicillium subrubescens]
MEYLELGDLYQYLHDKPALPELEAKEIAFQILEGLEMMHENDFAHRDLKPRNILIKARPPDEWWIKIADFGISKRIEDGHGQTSTLRGTPGYVAPEIWGFIERGSVYATDIWATGEILFEILVKRQVFAHLGLLSIYANKQMFPSDRLVTAGVSQEGVDFVSSLMKAQPKDRPTAKAALSNQWLATIPSPTLEDSDSRVSSVGDTYGTTPVPDLNSSSVEAMTEEFASWDTEELTQKKIQPRKPDNDITVLLGYNKTTPKSSTALNSNTAYNDAMSYSQNTSRSSTALDGSQNNFGQTVTISDNHTISRKPVAADKSPTPPPIPSKDESVIPRGEPRNSPGSTNAKVRVSPKSSPSKQSLSSWWKGFKANARKAEIKEEPSQGVFGVPLDVSIKYANVALSLISEEGDSMITGYVPIIIAKCGVFLKAKATDVKDIFAVNGSSEKIRELELSFDSPPRYGKGLDWSGYSVHDAANLLTRYLIQLPEPVIPLAFYHKFRAPFEMLGQDEDDIEALLVDPAVYEGALGAYQSLVEELPRNHKQLLAYMLDLLAVFAAKSEQTGMSTAHLVVIFQPALLAHPSHDTVLERNKLSGMVLTFLIENQDHFVASIRRTTAASRPIVTEGPGSLSHQWAGAGGY